jgi:hypothetical protein
MEWDRLATLILSAVAATGTVVTGGVNLARHWRETKQPTKAEANRWSLELATKADDGWRVAALRRKTEGAVGVRLRSIAIKSPSRSVIAHVSREQSKASKPDAATAARKIAFEENLRPLTTIAFPQPRLVETDYSLTSFIVSAPRPSRFNRWHSSRRVTIIVEAEETSSTRRIMRIKVTSQPIDWTASSPKAAT